MVEITRAAQVPRNGPEYSAFLYATICADANENPLSVLSAMARMNLDPWQEAANLAGLPVKAAASRLASLIVALPNRPPMQDEAGLVAARLITLLPQRGRPVPQLPQESRPSVPPYLQGVIKALSSKGAIYVILLLIVLTLGAKWFVASRAPTATAQTPVSETTVRPEVPLSH